MFPGQTLDEIPGLEDLLGIEAAGRFVEDQYFRVVDDRLREADTLAVALGELADQLRPDVLYKAARGRFFAALQYFFLGDPFDASHKLQVLANFHVGVQGRRFRQVADPLLDFKRLLDDIKTGDARRAFRGGHKAGEHAHRGGFSRAVRPEKTDDLPLLNREGYMIDRDVARVALRQSFDLDHKIFCFLTFKVNLHHTHRGMYFCTGFRHLREGRIKTGEPRLDHVDRTIHSQRRTRRLR